MKMQVSVLLVSFKKGCASSLMTAQNPVKSSVQKPAHFLPFIDTGRTPTEQPTGGTDAPPSSACDLQPAAGGDGGRCSEDRQSRPIHLGAKFTTAKISARLLTTTLPVEAEHRH